MRIEVERGSTVFVDLGEVIGAEEKNGVGSVGRLCVVIQNDRGNLARDAIIIAPLTDITHKKKKYKEHAIIKGNVAGFGVPKESVVDCGQIRTIDRSRIKQKFGKLDRATMFLVDEAIRESLGLKS